jgi:5-methylcytosine-specific restriction protein A
MLSELKPKKKERVCDLLERAGIKVPRNKNRFFLSLPAFNQPKIVVLNFWYENQIKQQGENIIVQWHLPTTSKEASPRMQRVHDAIKSAIKKKSKIRIIILYGNPAPKGSKVSKRSLDSAIWQVTDHNQETGVCTLTRGAEMENALDDLSVPPEGNSFPDRAKVVIQVIKRDNRVRIHAIKRAKGKCEYCNTQGFPTINGSFYLEAHHIIALCDSGRDTVDNVIALCPQHHRQAHYGADAESLEAQFVVILNGLNKRKTS